MSPSLRPAHVRLPQAKLSRIETLRAAPRNARTHSKKQLRQMARSITTFGFTNPVLVDASGEVIAGHGRLAAARMLGLSEVPTLCVDWLTEDQKRAYVIADNRLAEKAGWDRELLAIELGELGALEFDVTLTGFELREVELIIDAGAIPVQDDGIEEPVVGPAVCQLGDLWQLGQHRLLCADALDPASYTQLMGREKARLVVTDPPYNVKIGGHVSGLGRNKHREFVQGSGELSSNEFTQFLCGSLEGMAKASRDGSLHYVFMDWRHLPELLSAGQAVYDDWLNLCVWAKSNAGMGSLYRSQHELVAVYKKGKRPHVNNVELGANGRHRSNLWTYAGANTFKAGRAEELGWHPTVKPLDLICDILRDASDPGEIVLDGFGGSGTTLIAAAHSGRTARLIELDPLYCDVILRRYQTTFGEAPVHVPTGQSFTQRAQSAGMGATMSDTDDNDEGKVGYGRPPVHSRFKPGHSGNPKGRPKGQRNLASEIARAMAMPVPVTVNGRRKNVSTMTALLWRLREKALGGDHKSLQLLINLHQVNHADDKGQESLGALLAEDAAILRDAGLFDIGGHSDERNG